MNTAGITTVKVQLRHLLLFNNHNYKFFHEHVAKEITDKIWNYFINISNIYCPFLDVPVLCQININYNGRWILNMEEINYDLNNWKNYGRYLKIK